MINHKKHHENEYTIPELNNQKGPVLTLPNGTLVTFNRIVYRVGYEFDLFSYTEEEYNQAGLDILIEKTGMGKVEIEKVLEALHLYSPYKGIKSQIYWKLVGGKLNQQVNTYRSIWFVDLEKYDFYPTKEAKGKIVGRCRKWTGKYYRGSTVNEYEYDPSCLDPAYNQNFYLVKDNFRGQIFMVYPTDLTEIKNG